MKLLSTKEKYNLSNESIDKISQRYFDLLTDLKYENKNKLAIRLNIENFLLGYQEEFGENTEVTLVVATKIGTPRITLEIDGKEYNPMDDEDSFGNWNSALLQNMSVAPSVSYFNNKNYIQLKLHKPTMNPIFKLLLSLLAGGLIGGLGLLLPTEIRTAFQDNILSPVYNAFLGVLSLVGLTLVLLSTVSGIGEAGDISTFSKIGKRMVGGLMGVSALVLVISGFATLGLFNLNFTKVSAGTSQFGKIFELILQILPNNIIAPFYEGNALQIMVIGIAIGIALLALGDATRPLGKFFDQMFSVALFVMEFIEKFLPVFISIVLTQIMWSSEIKEIAGMWKLVLIGLCVCFVIIFVSIIYCAIKNKIKVSLLIKKLLPTFLLALSTASSSAVHGTCVECCNKKFGINSKLSTFGVSFAAGVFKPASAVIFFITSLYLAEMYQIEISAFWFITAFVICFIMSVATPPVAGGTAVAYTIIFIQLGIPTKVLAVILALDVVFDFVITATDKVVACTTLLNLASKNGLVNEKQLHKPE